MESKIFRSATVEECIKLASAELNISEKDMVYTVLEEKRGFFKKSSAISVLIEEKSKIESKDGTVRIKDGRIIIKNPEKNGRGAYLIPAKNVKLLIDGEEIKTKKQVFEESRIEYIFEETDAKRTININISPDNMKALISIEYKPKVTYELKDQKEDLTIEVEAVKKEEIYPPLFTVQDIKNELLRLGINYGFIEENIRKSVESREVVNLLIAEGTPPIDDVDDRLDLQFKCVQNPVEFVEDETGRVDYKNVGAVEAVKKGDIITVKINGSEGTDGRDIYGTIKKKKERKKINLRVGGGCVLKDSNTVEASIDGKPCIKNNVFYVFKIHEVMDDVDLSTGNIKFIGDVKIHGNVKEGMKVEAGNSIDIEKNVECAELAAKGDISVNGNLIGSKLTAGGEDILILSLLTNLKELKSTMKDLSNTVVEIKRFNLLGQKAADGEVIKVLLENKFKNIPRLCINIIRDISLQSGDRQDEVVTLIREKLIGMAPLGIRHFSELDGIAEAAERKIAELEGLLALPVNISISYCQDSTISSSGDIFIMGRGEYVSKITAHKGVYFCGNTSVARGGTIEAETEIKCKTVGSPAGVSTRLNVSSQGHIWSDVAYQNTILAVGGKEYILEKNSKNVHAYLDQTGELIVDKLSL